MNDSEAVKSLLRDWILGWLDEDVAGEELDVLVSLLETERVSVVRALYPDTDELIVDLARSTAFTERARSLLAWKEDA